jgi:hypothetical protein
MLFLATEGDSGAGFLNHGWARMNTDGCVQKSAKYGVKTDSRKVPFAFCPAFRRAAHLIIPYPQGVAETVRRLISATTPGS